MRRRFGGRGSGRGSKGGNGGCYCRLNVIEMRKLDHQRYTAKLKIPPACPCVQHVGVWGEKNREGREQEEERDGKQEGGTDGRWDGESKSERD